MHAEGSDLPRRVVLRPNTGKSGDALGYYAEVAASANENFFQLADKIHRANARLKGAQIKDRIADQLARAVEGDVTAAVCLMQLNSISGKELA
jgi:hypothetical protein